MDLVITEDDGWLELDEPEPPDLVPDLWEALQRGDADEVRNQLQMQGWVFSVDEDGEEDYEGELEFKAVTEPDDMLGERLRVWVRGDCFVIG